MRRVKKLVAVTGKYTNKDGQEKNQYVNCGHVFEREDGSRCMKLDSLPLGEWNGWVNEYDLEENRPQQNANGMQQARQSAAPAQQDNFEDPIPF